MAMSGAQRQQYGRTVLNREHSDDRVRRVKAYISATMTPPHIDSFTIDNFVNRESGKSEYSRIKA